VGRKSQITAIWAAVTEAAKERGREPGTERGGGTVGHQEPGPGAGSYQAARVPEGRDQQAGVGQRIDR
jgi:hypothetical protein